ncbi:MAG: hypothetical protein KAR83_05465 [Thermodesulfovibrionales bacterium]|nr:hypothetical protein [Thermodesulfovibrionales bacterium]
MNDADLFKRDFFNRLMEMSGRVFILVRHSDKVIIGHRGFSKDEKQSGITLVFNPDMHFIWDEAGISATLSFGSTAEKCVIPSSDIVAIFSPEAGVQMSFDPERLEAVSKDSKAVEKESSSKGSDPEVKGSSDHKVIRVDFHKRDD